MYFSIIFLHCQPSLTDEMRCFHRLYILAWKNKVNLNQEQNESAIQEGESAYFRFRSGISTSTSEDNDLVEIWILWMIAEHWFDTRLRTEAIDCPIAQLDLRTFWRSFRSQWRA